MALGVEGALELHHVGELLWVDVVVGEVHCHVLDFELHFGLLGCLSGECGERLGLG